MIAILLCIIMVWVIYLNYLEVNKIINKMIDYTSLIMLDLNVSSFKGITIDKNSH